MGEERKLVNFRMFPDEYEGLKILAELQGTTQVDIIRQLIKVELERQEEAISTYKKSLEEAKAKVKK